ncbi:ATP-dependent DNA ligase [Mycolicibacterium monacense]|uniref:DNA ligase (ATP) n=3 Tax=Mycobacteriaceae TaxID=1762 RepID=A0AAD1IZQ0_MYCMB|nr:ATP-dependent DNA ligase [Mycolicibacterium monacense]MDA4105426.1 ATP-dependent DNA ligase [Mycolicibacterium monacense DSM 44395]OBB60555.1 ATP-dependent DNA ligase [Mycolicibacterium monacense]OBF48252.1 ATP-dependent DNA ligase [Mycolicibacterium monacense]ORB15778.1 ATP-dependent DNA ligase [Mycolicibacterium monacense DSM 44395]BBZ63941.1 DNA ligase C1 [Mycolicibacterium monacense]
MDTMDLPVMPPLEPMLAKAQAKVPTESGVWSYEPKWDGFRALVFRDGDDVVLMSRSGKDLARYFPEVLDFVRDELAPRCVLDGEIVVPREIGGRTRLDWESLSQRIHPAESRVRKLSEETPAHFIGFDALASGDTSLMKEPFRARRQALIEAVSHKQWCHVTRTTEDPGLGAQWLEEFEGAGLDGVIAKRLDGSYLPGKREMVKVKHARDADCVAIGYRIHKSGEGIGSLLLGLYTDEGDLQMVGGAASFTAKDRLKLLAELEPLREGDEVREGDPSRWNSAADKRWIPIRPERVAEVAYDQMEGNSVQGRRFRHAVKFRRWRPDRDPASCTFDQLEVPLTYDLFDVLETQDG